MHERQRLPVRPHGAVRIGLGQGIVARLDEVAIDGVGRRRVALGEAGGETARRIDQIVRRKRQFALPHCRDLVGARLADDAPGGRGGERRRLPDVTLEETPLRLGIEGECPAQPVVRAGFLAGVERGALEHRIVEPRQVAAGNEGDLAVRRLSRCEPEGQPQHRHHEGDATNVAHGILPRAKPPGCGETLQANHDAVNTGDGARNTDKAGSVQARFSNASNITAACL